MSQPCRQLCLDERRRLFRLIDARMPVTEIARSLGRHRSTVYREIQRNRVELEPWPHGTLCHETIYRYVHGLEGRAADLHRLLPASHRQRHPRHARKPCPPFIPATRSIAHRPPEVASRQSFGHWEADLLIFRREHAKANLTSLVERQSRLVMVLPNPDRQSRPLISRIGRALEAFPASSCQTITFDRGTEFAAYPLLARQIGAEAYFCDPHAPRRGLLAASPLEIGLMACWPSMAEGQRRERQRPPPSLPAGQAQPDRAGRGRACGHRGHAQRHAAALSRLLHAPGDLRPAAGPPRRPGLSSEQPRRTSDRNRRVETQSSGLVSHGGLTRCRFHPSPRRQQPPITAERARRTNRLLSRRHP